MRGVGVVEVVEVPAAVGGEVGDDVGAVAEELPQVLGRGDAAGEAAAHADDDDRVVGGVGGVGDGRRGLVGVRLGVGAEEFGEEVVGQGAGGGVVEDGSGGQPEAGRRADAVAQFDRGERIEAQVTEGTGGVDAVARGVAQHHGRLVADEGEEGFASLGALESGELVGEAVLPGVAAVVRRTGALTRPRRTGGTVG
ncbi:hypothetical protein SALB_00292 [Streptomyces noursei]|uniref:Uncharacterized protein n=1 Tax=Streptomyces noursei TaxID=1971 RepID=A0A401QQJ5_STRNR|nr:hypothetical protein SALB_00292 [Streptomyces noursei]